MVRTSFERPAPGDRDPPPALLLVCDAIPGQPVATAQRWRAPRQTPLKSRKPLIPRRPWMSRTIQVPAEPLVQVEFAASSSGSICTNAVSGQGDPRRSPETDILRGCTPFQIRTLGQPPGSGDRSLRVYHGQDPPAEKRSIFQAAQ